MMKNKIFISGIIFAALAMLLFIDVKVNQPSENLKDNWLIEIDWEGLSSIKISKGPDASSISSKESSSLPRTSTHLM